MRLPWAAVLSCLVVMVLVLWRLRETLPPGRPRRLWAIWAVFFAAWFLALVSAPKGAGGAGWFDFLIWSLFSWLTLFVGQCAYALASLVAQGIRILARKGRSCRGRWIWLPSAAAAAAVFLAMWHGALVTRHALETHRVDVDIEGLPAAFDGYRIVQFSDLHADGSGADRDFVGRLVDTINALRPDLVVFTGDIVSRRSAELVPYTGILSRIRARDGVYSILGNHDYEDYAHWDTPSEKAASHLRLIGMQRAMGWHVMLDSTAWLRRGSDSLALIGVENIGDPPFRVYGSLSRACPGIERIPHSILLTHNPRHWTDSVAGRLPADLTLSGHTHAMQIELLGWSPAAWRYDTWGGLYDDGRGHRLYVNTGTGTVGMPMRLGAAPEVTLITLHAK